MGNIRLYGDTSGYTEIAPPAVGGNNVVQLPTSGTVASIKVQASAPTGPASGDLWLKSTTNEFYVYNGTAWIAAGGSGSKSFAMFLGGL